MVMNDVIAEADKQPEIAHTFSTFRANVPHYLYVYDIDREKAQQLGIPLSIFQTHKVILVHCTWSDFSSLVRTSA
ncbi:hypothetical protein O9993_00540 [Vibrio lentus]|nr:hypothetical protein [Vibrio lentus]